MFFQYNDTLYYLNEEFPEKKLYDQYLLTWFSDGI